ncbi:MAG TPA: ATP-dependent protease, partial [Halieaceae bacterium]|nr:ATP-dependent protease [Halieaceae bacterium]
MSTTELPLFPLSAVLLPYGKMPLQIFEQRYLDLVRDCMKSGTDFGVVWIRRGEEVAVKGSRQQLGDLGTLARIVDFDQLPNGLLGVTIEGRERF